MTQLDCSVCGFGQVNDNLVLSCSDCGFACHAKCILQRQTSPFSQWTCDVCRYSQGETTSCLVCTQHSKTGLVSFIRKGQRLWFHPVCALVAQETQFYTSPEGETAVRPVQRRNVFDRTKCAVCSSDQGFLISCSVQTCKCSVHLQCGIRSKGVLSLAEDAGRRKCQRFSMVCGKHYESNSLLSFQQSIGKAVFRSIQNMLHSEIDSLVEEFDQLQCKADKPLHPFFGGKSTLSQDCSLVVKSVKKSSKKRKASKREILDLSESPLKTVAESSGRKSLAERQEWVKDFNKELFEGKELHPFFSSGPRNKTQSSVDEEQYTLQGLDPPNHLPHVGYEFVRVEQDNPLPEISQPCLKLCDDLNYSTTECLSSCDYNKVNDSIAYPRQFQYFSAALENPSEILANDICQSLIHSYNQLAPKSIQKHYSAYRKQFLNCTLENSCWLEKYTPKNSKYFLGNTSTYSQLKDWFRDISSLNRELGSFEEEFEGRCNPCVFIQGPTASGKTSAVYSIAKEMAFNVVEINSNTKRTRKYLLHDIIEATQSHSVKSTKSSQKSKQMSKSILLMEDIDVVYADETGLQACILSLIASSKQPIVLIANENIKEFSDAVTLVLCTEKPNLGQSMMKLFLIGYLELGLGPDSLSDLQVLFESNECDLRKSLLQLEFYARSRIHQRFCPVLEFTESLPALKSFALELSEAPTVSHLEQSCLLFEMASVCGIELAFDNILSLAAAAENGDDALFRFADYSDAYSLLVGEESVSHLSSGHLHQQSFTKAFLISEFKRDLSLTTTDLHVSLLKTPAMKYPSELFDRVLSDCYGRRRFVSSSMHSMDSLYRLSFMRMFCSVSADTTTQRKTRRSRSSRCHYLGRALGIDTLDALQSSFHEWTEILCD